MIKKNTHTIDSEVLVLHITRYKHSVARNLPMYIQTEKAINKMGWTDGKPWTVILRPDRLGIYPATQDSLLSRDANAALREGIRDGGRLD